MHTYPTNQIQTKQHFLILDGLRGIAAISVVIYHFMEFIVPDYHQNFIAHGHLAVDFFFCLSGFVIAYAYDHRIEQIGITNFLKLRFIRLHPLVIIGSVIGLITFIFDPFSNLYAQYAGSKTLFMFLTSC
ncbi:MAG: acyltransferase, partial [Pedobacter sp.]